MYDTQTAKIFSVLWAIVLCLVLFVGYLMVTIGFPLLQSDERIVCLAAWTASLFFVYWKLRTYFHIVLRNGIKTDKD